MPSGECGLAEIGSAEEAPSRKDTWSWSSPLARKACYKKRGESFYSFSFLLRGGLEGMACKRRQRRRRRRRSLRRRRRSLRVGGWIQPDLEIRSQKRFSFQEGKDLPLRLKEKRARIPLVIFLVCCCAVPFPSHCPTLTNWTTLQSE